MCTDIGIPPVWQYPTSMWQSTTIEVPMKPIAPMPMLVAKLLELFFQRGNLRVRIARPDDAQARRLLAEHH